MEVYGYYAHVRSPLDGTLIKRHECTCSLTSTYHCAMRTFGMRHVSHKYWVHLWLPTHPHDNTGSLEIN